MREKSDLQILQEQKVLRASRLLLLVPRLTALVLQDQELFKEKLERFVKFFEEMQRIIARQRPLVAKDSQSAHRLDEESAEVAEVLKHLKSTLKGARFDADELSSFLINVQAHDATITKAA